MEIPKPQGPADAQRPLTTAVPERGPPAAAASPLPADRSSIKPLDLPGALQILIAEVRLALSEAGLRPPDPALEEALQRWAAGQPAVALLLADAELTQAAMTTPARALLEVFLRALPAKDVPPQAWLAAVQKLTQALAGGSAAAIERIGAWRDTPAKLPAMLDQTRGLALRLLAEDAPLPLLTRPEWLGIAAALTRFHRLRRRQRRLLLSDTDADWLDEDESLDAPAAPADGASQECAQAPPLRERKT